MTLSAILLCLQITELFSKPLPITASNHCFRRFQRSSDPRHFSEKHFSGKHLSEKQLSGKQLSEKQLSGKHLAKKRFSEKYLSGKHFLGKRLSEKRLSGMYLSGMHLSEVFCGQFLHYGRPAGCGSATGEMSAVCLLSGIVPLYGQG